MVCDCRRVFTILAFRNLLRCWDRADWLNVGNSASISETDRSVPSDRCVIICSRLLLLMAFSIAVDRDSSIRGSCGLAMLSSVRRIYSLKTIVKNSKLKYTHSCVKRTLMANHPTAETRRISGGLSGAGQQTLSRIDEGINEGAVRRLR